MYKKHALFFNSLIAILISLLIGEFWIRSQDLAQSGLDRLTHPYIMLGGFQQGGLLKKKGHLDEQPEAYGYESRGFFGFPSFRYGTPVHSVAERGHFLFRDRAKLIETPKDRDTIRIFILGGSVAYGEGASAPARRWFIQLENLLQKKSRRKIQIIPAANHSHVTTQERIIQDLYVLPYEPDVMIFLNGFNDANTGVSATRPGDPFGQGIIYLRDSSAFFNFMTDISKHSALVRYWMQRDMIKANHPVAPDEKSMQLQAESVAAVYYDNSRRMHHRCETEKRKCFFFLQPFWDLTLENRKEKAIVSDDMVGRNYAKIRSQLSQNVFVTDLTGVFDDPAERVPFYDPAHFDDEGHYRIAKAISEIMFRDAGFQKLLRSR